MADGIYGVQKASGPSISSAGKSFVGSVLARLPFSYQIIDRITELNPKYEIFNKLSADRDTRVAQQSVFRGLKPLGVDEDQIGNLFSNKGYHELMYANIELDKVKRLQDYRRMATFAELSNCIDEICDDILTEDEHNNIVTLAVDEKNYSKAIRDEIDKEWIKFVYNFKLNENGWGYFRNLVIDGELFFENTISQEHPEYGIIGVNILPTELVSPIYDNVNNDEIKGFMLRKPIVNPKTQMIEKDEFVVMQKNQITYINSGVWNEDRSIRLPLIEKARRAYKQLSLVEDSIIIHRLVRAPERLVFKVDTGNMSPPKSEAYLKRLQQQFWAKKTYDVSSGRITNVYEPQSYLDAYFFAKRAGTEGTSVETLNSSQNFGNIDDLMYFIKKLYEAMSVPVGRLNPEDKYNDGTEMSRSELKFAKMLIRIQKRFAIGLRASFITHLKLRNMWDNFKIKERDLNIAFNTPTLFMLLKQQQIFDVKYNNFNNMATNEGIASSFAQEEYLGLTPEQMARNREWRRKDAAFTYEVEQILANGPNWKAQIQAAQAAANEIGGGGGGGGAAGAPPAGGEGSELPEFGPSPTGGEGEAQGQGGEAQPPAAGAAPPATQPTTAAAAETPAQA